MKKITFNSVKIQNFLSIGENPIELSFNQGITLITGDNKDKGGKNGVGKSSILESIYWCLFGNTIRELKTEKIVHNLSDKGGYVALNINIQTTNTNKNYIITRNIKPSKISIVCDGEDITHSTIPKNDDIIKELIGGNEELFQNAIIMSANNSVPFMAQKKIDKRKFIEGILNLNIFSEMLLKTRSDYNDLKKENDILSQNFTNEQRTLKIYEEQRDSFEVRKNERIKVIQDKISNEEIELNKLKDMDIASNDAVKQEIKEVEDKIKILQDALCDINKSMIELGKSKATFSSEAKQAKNEKQKILDKGDTCPTCNRQYCEDDLTHITQELSKLDVRIKTAEDAASEISDKENLTLDKGKKIQDGLDKLKKKIRGLNEEASKASLHQEKIKNTEKKINEYRLDVSNIEKEKDNSLEKIKNSEQSIKKLKSDLENIKKELSVLETAKFIVSEEGVKTFIIKKMLNLLNNKLNYYLKLLDTPCKCEFNEFFEETIYNDNGKECSYHNFSGGEKVRINIATLFMFQDVLKSQSAISYSLNIYDELLDSAIDQKGAEKILEILRDRVQKYNESIYIVSHNSNIKSNIDNTILLEKENGSTKIVS